MKVFLDANVLFTAAYSPQGLSARIIHHGHEAGLSLFTHLYALDEAQRNLEKKAPKSMPQLRALLDRIHLVPMPPTGLVPPGLPAKDHPIWLGALASGCEVLLTGDQGDFAGLPEHPRLRVMNPRELFGNVFG